MKSLNIKQKFKDILSLDESSERLSLAFAIGVFIAFSPTIGLHTVSVIAAAYLFRLNIGALFLGVFINNPWTMVPIYAACLWAGMKITGQAAETSIDWSNITFSNSYEILSPFLLSFVIGTVLIGIVAAVASYFIMKSIIQRSRQKKETSLAL